MTSAQNNIEDVPECKNLIEVRRVLRIPEDLTIHEDPY